ncbi:hypothetical protein SAMN05421678_1254 [Actinopolymorpha cephalotaxi]|uniref:Metallo-beta-lactamase domain-containing protein n=1 Tax=Actinopolymorpha cephalotaxi TaxID=504797 RepID=A0A1I3BM17_9ACTN|nr:hydrolase [Actinopolymorpha cephalotaxi]NYH82846.1 hypothetical protein [Actinopolymorpha cephalotaxi]SFH62969.1 hypothetical protein SAMN05421678_1254 [Actinopolymorpha cephalotaxi]
MTHWICGTCSVEYADTPEPPSSCPICTDERQYVPPTGQAWTTTKDRAAAGHRTRIEPVGPHEPGLHRVSVEPKVGIGQITLLVQTEAGNLMWDPAGFVDQDAVDAITALGGLAAIASSHPHMFGVQVEWSHAFSGVPVYVNEADRRWLGRNDEVVRLWSGTHEPLPGITLIQAGGHFRGSSVAHWAAGAGGRGVLLSGDTIFPVADRRWVTFMRSFPNSIPLSAAAVRRIVDRVEPYDFERLHGNFGAVVEEDAKGAVRRSADRYIGWVSGDFDSDT